MHAGKDGAIECRQDLFQPDDIGAEKAREVFGCLRDAKLLKEIAHDCRVGAAGEIKVFGGVRDVKFEFANFGECFFARAAGLDERAVDIEEDEADHVIRTGMPLLTRYCFTSATVCWPK